MSQKKLDLKAHQVAASWKIHLKENLNATRTLADRSGSAIQVSFCLRQRKNLDHGLDSHSKPGCISAVLPCFCDLYR
jgi:hypothetical protein